MFKEDQGEKNFRELLSLYLQRRQSNKEASANQPHFDEDTLSAFIEGTLSQRQAAPILKHLVECNFCRHITAKLAESAEELENLSDKTEVTGTNVWQDFWNSLTEGISFSDKNAVLAHEDKKPDEMLKDSTRKE